MVDNAQGSCFFRKPLPPPQSAGAEYYIIIIRCCLLLHRGCVAINELKVIKVKDTGAGTMEVITILT